uniref:Retrotransposon gag domain-containing protein n=1 Tax=Chenopodium quinoa TaxID=63459 RepID=A0A803MP09_CHEQI
MANEIKLSEFFTPGTYNSPVGNRMPNVEGNFEIKPQIIQMLPTFYGLEYENPYKHIDAFLEVCSTFSISDAAADAIRMRLFNFSLKEKAKEWLNNRNVTTWAQLQKDFLKKFYSIGKLSDMRRAITTFSQKPNELFYEAWERFCSLLRECPHHEVPKWQLIHSFYYGLSEHNQQMVDASCGGNFMQKNSDEAWQLFEDLSENSQQHATSSHTNASNASRTLGGKGGIYEVSHTHDLAYKVDALTKKMDQVDILNKKIDQLVNTNNLHVNSINANEGCATCAQTYASQPSQPASSNPDLEKIISSLGAVTTSVQNIENKMHVVDSHTQSIAKLETQIGQLANAIGKRDDGKLPSTSIANPKGLNHEQTQAIMTLRNGKELFNKISNKKGDNDNGESINAESEIAKNKEKSPSPKNDESVITIPYEPRIPYLQALDAPSLYGKNKQKEDILEIFKQVRRDGCFCFEYEN